nr:hypothetical protein Iba_chr03bCG0430 [Ipomoea batatas]
MLHWRPEFVSIVDSLEGRTTWKPTAWNGEQVGSQQLGEQLGSQQLVRKNNLEGRTTWKPTAWKGEHVFTTAHESPARKSATHASCLEST